MKVLTIRQPWASLIINGYKKYEFRAWKTNYRGELLIHAGKSIDKDAMERLKKYIDCYLPLGEIIGKVSLTDCIKTSQHFFEKIRKENRDIYSRSIFKEEYAFKLDNVEKFDIPIKVNGKLGLWDYDI